MNAFDSVSVQKLAEAARILTEVSEETPNGLVSDHCQNAIREVRSAVRWAIGGEFGA